MIGGAANPTKSSPEVPEWYEAVRKACAIPPNYLETMNASTSVFKSRIDILHTLHLYSLKMIVCEVSRHLSEWRVLNEKDITVVEKQSSLEAHTSLIKFKPLEGCSSPFSLLIVSKARTPSHIGTSLHDVRTGNESCLCSNLLLFENSDLDAINRRLRLAEEAMYSSFVGKTVKREIQFTIQRLEKGSCSDFIKTLSVFIGFGGEYRRDDEWKMKPTNQVSVRY